MNLLPPLRCRLGKRVRHGVEPHLAQALHLAVGDHKLAVDELHACFAIGARPFLPLTFLKITGHNLPVVLATQPHGHELFLLEVRRRGTLGDLHQHRSLVLRGLGAIGGHAAAIPRRQRATGNRVTVLCRGRLHRRRVTHVRIGQRTLTRRGGRLSRWNRCHCGHWAVSRWHLGLGCRLSRRLKPRVHSFKHAAHERAADTGLQRFLGDLLPRFLRVEGVTLQHALHELVGGFFK